MFITALHPWQSNPREVTLVQTIVLIISIQSFSWEVSETRPSSDHEMGKFLKQTKKIIKLKLVAFLS